MAEQFKARNLSVLAYTNGFTLWHYITPDTWDNLVSDGYFEDARDMLRTGDFVVANVERDDEMSGGLLVVCGHGVQGVKVKSLSMTN